ncbi:hypothetical protein [Jannaschia rubra]|uniref:hypothetical protein n=1 Tax=Jannaschia rubra TaxID=282197 RepID=UPI002490E1DF|nr:hypothetical protein [Jannaschia rubra]
MADGAVAAGHAVALRSLLLAVASGAALVLVFVRADWLALAAMAALLAYLWLGRRLFTLGTWVPVALSLAALAVAVARGTSAPVLLHAVDRSLFLAALITLLGTLRAAASLAPEVAQAGTYLTGQPPSRRYLSLTFGGHLFGVLINFGGLAILLDLAARSMRGEATLRLPPDLREVKLRRMTVAIVRGFGLISLWSPFGFATNVVLITLPGLTYLDFGPIGFAASFVFVAIGWAFDRVGNRRLRALPSARAAPPPGAWRGAAMLPLHVAALGIAIFALHEVAPLDFQEALIVLVPAYSALWAGWSGLRVGVGPAGGVAAAGRDAWARLPRMAGEVGVFAAAGFLSVILLAIVPVDALRALIANLGLGPVALTLGLALSVLGLAFVGINPIVTSSVLGAIASQLAVPGLSDLAIALAIIGGWTGVIGLSPFITTILFCAAIIDRPAMRIGPVWNGAYSLTIFAVWCACLGAAVALGAV